LQFLVPHPRKNPILHSGQQSPASQSLVIAEVASRAVNPIVTRTSCGSLSLFWEAGAATRKAISKPPDTVAHPR
jgi:hypothetical protein